MAEVETPAFFYTDYKSQLIPQSKLRCFIIIMIFVGRILTFGETP